MCKISLLKDKLQEQNGESVYLNHFSSGFNNWWNRPSLKKLKDSTGEQASHRVSMTGTVLNMIIFLNNGLASDRASLSAAWN